MHPIPAPPLADASDAAETSDPSPAQLLDLAVRLESARQDERTLLARELHDDIGGTLAAMKMVVARLRNQPTSVPVRADLDELHSLCDTATRATHNVIHALRPGILDQGLVGALEWECREFQRRHGVTCHFVTNRDTIDIPKGQGVAVYRICQEALTNIAKHAEATVVRVELHRDAEGLSLEVTDDGHGFDPRAERAPDSFGIVGMHERAKAYGGWIEVTSQPGAGSVVMLSLPLRRALDQPR